MADTPATSAPGGRQRGNTLGLRLALAFLGVSLAAVALLAVLAAVFSAVDVSQLANRQRGELAGAFAVAAAGSWNADRGWPARTSRPSATWPNAAACSSSCGTTRVAR